MMSHFSKLRAGTELEEGWRPVLFAQSPTGSLTIPRAVEFPYLLKGYFNQSLWWEKSPGTSCSPVGLGSFFMFSCFIYCLKKDDGWFFPSEDCFMAPGLGERFILTQRKMTFPVWNTALWSGQANRMSDFCWTKTYSLLTLSAIFTCPSPACRSHSKLRIFDFISRVGITESDLIFFSLKSLCSFEHSSGTWWPVHTSHWPALWPSRLAHAIDIIIALLYLFQVPWQEEVERSHLEQANCSPTLLAA